MAGRVSSSYRGGQRRKAHKGGKRKGGHPYGRANKGSGRPWGPQSVEFTLGAMDLKQCPDDGLPEVAFVGRSNVGKSTLLNRLFRRRKMVRTSRTPGCTRQINYFRVDDRLWFVDLPGYGFAKVRRDDRQVWDRLLGSYLTTRRSLQLVVLLMDLRRGVTEIDDLMIELLTSQGIPWLPVLTKIDKLGGNARQRESARVREHLMRGTHFGLPDPVACSGLNGEGADSLWWRIESLIAGYLTDLPRDDHPVDQPDAPHEPT